MTEDAPVYKSSRERVRELKDKRGPGNQFKPSPLTEKEKKEFAKRQRRLRIKENNKAGF